MDAWIDVASSGISLQDWLQVGLRASPLVSERWATRTLYLRAGTYRLRSDTVVPGGVDLRFERGALITGPVALTILGRVVAPEAAIFDVPGGLTVQLVGRQTPQVTPQWWGARGDGRTLDGASFAAMASAIRADGPSVVSIPAGIYVLDRTVSLPTGKRYVGQGRSGAVVLRRGSGFEGTLCLCRNDGDAASRVHFTGLTFDGNGGVGNLLRFAPTSRRVQFEAVVTESTFTRSGSPALELQNGSEYRLSNCVFQQCAGAIRAVYSGSSAARVHVGIDRVISTGEGGQVVLDGGNGLVMTVVDSHLSGQIQLRDLKDGDVRIMDSTCGGLEVDAPGCRVGVVGCSLVAVEPTEGAAVVRQARQVTLQGCQVEVRPRSKQTAAILIAWSAGAEGAVLVDGCTLTRAAASEPGQAGVEITDSGGPGTREVHVLRTTVGAGYALGGRLIGGRGSFRELDLQCVGGFELQRNSAGLGPVVTIASLRYMPIGASVPGPYLRLVPSSRGVTPFSVRHEDVSLELEFNLIEANRDELEALQLTGARHIRGPVLTPDARPMGLSGLLGDVFRPSNLLQSAQTPGWPTEWLCVRSGVGSEAAWQPICRRPPSPFLDDAPQKVHVEGSSLFNPQDPHEANAWLRPGNTS